MAQLKSNQEARSSMYKDVLTTDQYTKYEAWEAEKKAKMEARMKEHQAEQSNAGQSTTGQKATKAAKGSKTGQKASSATGGEEHEEEL